MDLISTHLPDARGSGDRACFLFVVLFLAIDMGRLQDFLPVGQFRPGLILSAALALYAFRRKAFWWDHPQIRTILLFALLLFLHIPFARNNFYAYRIWEFFVSLLVCLLCLVSTLHSTGRVRKIANFLIMIMVFVSILGILHKGKGSGGYFTDENDLALFINMILPFCFFLLQFQFSIAERALYVCGLVLGVASVVISFSRGGFLGLLAVGFTAWVFSKRRVRSALVILVLALGVFFAAGDSYWEEMSTITNTSEKTALDRIESWRAAWNMFLDNPLGVGGGNFQVQFETYQSGYFKRGMWGRVAHSLWFTLLSELGVLGVLLYIRLLIQNFRDIAYVIKSVSGENVGGDLAYLRNVCLGALCGMMGYFVSGTFLSVLYYPFYWYLSGIIGACARLVRATNNGIAEQDDGNTKETTERTRNGPVDVRRVA